MKTNTVASLLFRALVGIAVGLFLGHGRTQGAEPGAPPSAGPPVSRLREYRTPSLILITDLPEAQAKAAIGNLQRTLAQAAKYWGQEPRGQIECYLLHDAESLPDSELPHRLARVLVGGVGGATLPNRSRSRTAVRNMPTVFASTRPGVAEHELVHAYCTQTFGFTGPDWYKEGMAEIAVLGCTRESGVVCSPEQIELLRGSHQVDIQQILATGKSGQKIFDSLKAMLDDPKNRNRHVPLSDWSRIDSDNVASARQEYLRSWALCYMLLHNPNFSNRFRALGRRYVVSEKDEFGTLFASLEREIVFEYSFFLRNIDVGYRVDLCSWDWNKRFRPAKRGSPTSVRVLAGKGYQSSGLSVIAGQRYSYQTEGTWNTSQLREATAADGGSDHRGRLMGIVFKDYRLSEPLYLGSQGTFAAPVSGNLYLRCNDAWNEVHDNEGQTVVRLDEI